MISEKSVTRRTFLSCVGLHQKSQQGTRISNLFTPEITLLWINTYIITEGRNFKTFLKENYATFLHSCYIFTI